MKLFNYLMSIYNKFVGRRCWHSESTLIESYGGYFKAECNHCKKIFFIKTNLN